jgi:hypothetical protein
VKLDNVGTVWGDDVPGRLFGEKLVSSIATIRQLLVDMEDDLFEIGHTFYTMSADVQNTEEEAF